MRLAFSIASAMAHFRAGHGLSPVLQSLCWDEYMITPRNRDASLSQEQTRYAARPCCPLKVALQFTCSALPSRDECAKVRGITAQVQARGSSWVIWNGAEIG